MGELSSFFKESTTSLGLFYPKHYVIATFPKYSSAQTAGQTLRDAGFREDDVMVATGDEVLGFFKHFREDAGLWGIVMRPISRFFGTEATFADQDIVHAHEGAGLLAVHSLTEQDTKRITSNLAPLEPSSMEWYLPGGVRSLV
jgi:hypothetical protein